MQNIPGDDWIRALFIPTPGMVFYDFDFSQIEGRVFAHISQDPILLSYYREGGDIHTATSDKLGIPRKLAKIINFAIIYGCAPKKLVEIMSKEGFHYDLKQAKELKNNFWGAYSVAYRFVENFKKQVHSEKQAFTIFGRRRLFPTIDVADEMEVFSMEREAVNFIVQGSSADIMKKAMVDVNSGLKLAGNPAYMLLTVHDELLNEGYPEKKEEAMRIIGHRMTDCVTLSVPLLVEGNIGKNWSECH